LAIPTGQEDKGHTLEEKWRGHIIFLDEGKFPAAFFFFLSSVKLAPELNFPSLFRGQYLWVWAKSPVALQMGQMIKEHQLIIRNEIRLDKGYNVGF